MLELLDLAGTFVFAVAGAFRAARHDLDLLGIMVLAVITGVGGGLIRDMLIGATPAAALQDERYLTVCAAGGILVFFAAPHVEARWRVVMLADAIGLGVFAAVGAAKGLAFGLGPIGVVIMAALTATGGGVIRDLLVQEIPAVIRNDFYATAALIGGGVYFLLARIPAPEAVTLWTAAVVTTGARLFAMYRGVNLPRARTR